MAEEQITEEQAAPEPPAPAPDPLAGYSREELARIIVNAPCGKHTWGPKAPCKLAGRCDCWKSHI